jgi:hypothetical protein
MNLNQDFTTHGLLIKGGTYSASFRRWAEANPTAPFPSRKILAARCGTSTTSLDASHAPAAPKLEWWDDTTIWESGVLRRATPEELAGRYN